MQDVRRAVSSGSPGSFRYRDAAISDARGQPLQQCRQAVQARVPVAERVDVLSGAGLQQLLEEVHQAGERQQECLVASALCEDLRDLRVNHQG